MKQYELLASTVTPDGLQLTLSVHDGDYYIDVDGKALMSTRATGSEKALADFAAREMAGNPHPPSAANSRQMPSPMPSPPPVTIATFSWIRPILPRFAATPRHDQRSMKPRCASRENHGEVSEGDETHLMIDGESRTLCGLWFDSSLGFELRSCLVQ